jgi:hypothetical protein
VARLTSGRRGPVEGWVRSGSFWRSRRGRIAGGDGRSRAGRVRRRLGSSAERAPAGSRW